MLTADLDYSRQLGCEYEMTFPLVGASSSSGMDVQNTIKNVLNANGLRSVARGYSHEPVPNSCDLAVETDGSVRGETEWNGVVWHPVELKTRIVDLGDWERIVPKALEICNYLGGRVNASCGHHVHIALPELRQNPKVIRSLYNLVLRYEQTIYGLVAPSRRTNHYCSPLPFRPDLFDRCRSVGDYCMQIRDNLGRSGLNLQHLEEANPHIEFRYHGGTGNPEKARHWLRLLLQMTKHAITRSCQTPTEQVANDRQGIENLLITCGFKPNSGIYTKVCPELRETGKWLLRRWKELNHGGALKPKINGAKRKKTETETEGGE